MELYKYIQTTFAGGIMSSKYNGRTDWQQYYNSVEEGMNVVFHPTGGVSNRFGTEFIGLTKYADKVCRIIPFRFSDTEQMLLEVGHQYIRFWKDDKQVLAVNGMAYEIYAPYIEADLKDLKWVQSADTIYLLHKKYRTQELRRYGNNDWQLVPFEFVNGPFFDWNTDPDLTMQLYWNTEDLSYALASNTHYFKMGMEGALFKIKKTLPSSSTTKVLATTAEVSKFISDGNYRIVTSGSWSGYLILETSSDQVLWKEERKWHSPNTQYPQNINIASEIKNEKIQWYRLRFDRTDGTLNVAFSCDAFSYDLMCRITNMQPYSGGVPYHYGEYTRANVELLNGVVGLNDYVSQNDNDLKIVVPEMTSYTTPSGTASGQLDGVGNIADSWRVWTNAGGSFEGKKEYSNFYMRFTYKFAAGQEKYIDHIKYDYNYGNFYTAGVASRVSITVVAAEGSNVYVTAEIPYIKNKTIHIPLVKAKGIIVTFSNFTKYMYENYYGAIIRNIQVYGYDNKPADIATIDWAEGAWSEYRGFPSCGAFYQDRLALASNTFQPYTLWMSKTGIYNDFGISDPYVESDSININIPSARRELPDINNILVVSSRLLVLSASSEISVSIHPNVAIDYQGERGSNKCVPVIVGNTVLYVTAGGGSIRELAYSFASDQYEGDEISLKAKGLFAGRNITACAYQQEPDSIVYCVMDDGKILTVTYIKEQQIVAWAEQETQGNFEDIAVLNNGTSDDMYMVVERNNVRMIEKMKARTEVDSLDEGIFLDCATVKDVSAAKEHKMPYLPYEGYYVVGNGQPDNAFSINDTIWFTGVSWEKPSTMWCYTHFPKSIVLTRYAIVKGGAYPWTDNVKSWRVYRVYTDQSEYEIDHQVNASAMGSGGLDEFTVSNAAQAPIIKFLFYESWGGECRYQLKKIIIYFKYADEIDPNIVTGLERFNGKEVVAICDGERKEVHTVADGKITLNEPSNKTVVGLPYQSRIKTLSAVAEDKMSGQTIMDCKARIVNVFCKWRKALPGKIGDSNFDLDDVVYIKPEGTGLFTGHTTQSIKSSHDYDKSIVYEHSEPVPFTLLMMVLKIDLGQE